MKTILTYVASLLVVAFVLKRVGLPIGLVVPFVILVAALGSVLKRMPFREAVMGESPPRRATGEAAGMLLGGEMSLFLLFPGDAGEGWFVIFLPIWWMGISLLAFAFVSLMPEGPRRGTWVTIAGLIFMVVGTPTVLALAVGAFGDAELESRGAMQAVFVLAAAMFVSVPMYLRADAAELF